MVLLYDTRDSPFLDLGSPFTAGEAVKLVLLVGTIPLRLAVIFWSVVAVAIVNSAAIWGCDLERPLPAWRRRVVEVASEAACGAVLRAMGFWRPRLVGAENYARGCELGAIGIFNHVSYLDAFVVVWAFCAAGVTFSFTRGLPILGYGIQALQNLYLPADKDKEAQQRSMVALIRERAANHDMPMLSVAPEGTLSDGRCLLSFKRGAFVAGVPVVPILLRYRLQPMNPSWGVIKPLWHAVRLMCQFSNAVTVECLPPYTPSQAERDDPALYAANIRSLMADALGVRLVDQDRSTYLALVNAGVGVSWDGRRVTAPPGLLDEQGRLDLEPYLPANFKRAAAGKKAA